MPALESSHALAHAMKIAPGMGKDKVLLVNLSGRGDKDMHTVAKYSGINFDDGVRREARGVRRVTAAASALVDVASRLCASASRLTPHDMSRIPATFEALQARRRKALIPFITAGDPSIERHRAAHARAGGSRRRHHRAGHAVLRSDGRRPGDPALERARAEAATPICRRCSARWSSSAAGTAARRWC